MKAASNTLHRIKKIKKQKAQWEQFQEDWKRFKSQWGTFQSQWKKLYAKEFYRYTTPTTYSESTDIPDNYTGKTKTYLRKSIKLDDNVI